MSADSESAGPDGAVGGTAARVVQTGIALVHEGELVLPAAGSEAQAKIVSDDSRTIVNYYFPVEIEVLSSPPPPDNEHLVQLTLKRLVQGLESV